MNSRRRVNSTVMRLHSVKPTVITIAALVVCLPLALTGFVQSRSDDSLDKAVLDLFVSYPESNDLNVIVHSHARREPLGKSGAAFYSTWYPAGNPRVAMATIVDNDGHAFTYPLRNSEVGPTHSRWKRLPDVNSASFLATVRTLPDTISGVAVANLVIVSFRVDGRWQTRLYDRTKPPAELVNLYRLLQAPLDSN